jgi:tRNA (guanine26-N2/guanine27-N2)-dimethyltransferase
MGSCIFWSAVLVRRCHISSLYGPLAHAIKTDAPNSVVEDIMRTWCKTNPPKKLPLAGSTAAKILAIKSSIEADFTIPKGMTNAKSEGVVQFPMNPEPNWGPKAKAPGNKRKAEDSGKAS